MEEAKAKKPTKATATAAPTTEPDATDKIPQTVWIAPTQKQGGVAERQVNIGTAFRLMEKKKTWKPKTKADSDAIERYRAATTLERAKAQEGDCGCGQT